MVHDICSIFPAGRATARLIATAICGLGLIASAAAPVRAESRSSALGVEIALLAGRVHEGVGYAGLDLALQPGWKTYWRYPGDSGIPPDLDMSGSTNISGLEVGFPAPERFASGGDQTIGYHAPVTLLLKARLADPAKPARLVIAARLGVCREICVPVDAALSVDLSATAAVDPAIADSLDRIARDLPKPVQPGADYSVVAVKRDAATKPETVTFVVKAPAGKLKDVFVEGPEGWALPLPDRQPGAEAESRWTFALDGLPGGAKAPGTPLTFTIVGEGAATTQRWVLE